MKKSIGIGEVAEVLGVCVTTLRRWNKEKRLVPAFRTKGGHEKTIKKPKPSKKISPLMFWKLSLYFQQDYMTKDHIKINKI